MAWSLIWNEQYGVNTETTFKTEEEAARYAGRCLTSAKPRVVALYDHPVPAVESAQVTDVEDAILACERGNTVYDVLANYRAVRRTIQDIRASLATDAEG